MQAVGISISGSFTIAFATVKFICQYSYGVGTKSSEPQFSYTMEGQDTQLYEIVLNKPTGPSANVVITIQPWIPV